MSFIKNLSKAAKSGQVLAPLIENYYGVGKFPDRIEIVVEPNKESDTAFHPSSHSMQCLAETYVSMYHNLGGDPEMNLVLPQQKHSASTQRIFQIGHAIHGLLQTALCDMGLTRPEFIEHEFRRTNDGTELDCSLDWRIDPLIEDALWWCRGSADISHCALPDGEDVLVDVKTCSSFAFNNVGRDTGFWPKYEAQVQLYLDWHNVERGIVLYMSKDTPHAFKERIVERDPSFVDEIYDRWTEVAERVKANEPPRCECHEDKACAGRSILKRARV